MKNVLVFIFIVCIINACRERSHTGTDDTGTARKLPTDMQYSYDCLLKDSSDYTDVLQKADDVIGNLFTYNIEVSDEEQMRFGDSILQESITNKEFTIAQQHKDLPKLNAILKKLVDQRHQPSAITYQVFVLRNDTTINAYTVGGKIFITTAMLGAVKNTDQLYAILGHEIGHNEKGHIKKSLAQIKASKKYFGKWGPTAVAIKKMLTGSFNQRNELEADYYGLDLTWKAGYDICAIKSFWDLLSKDETDAGWLDFFRTHPYSNVRSQCLQNHIAQNFKLPCP